MTVRAFIEELETGAYRNFSPDEPTPSGAQRRPTRFDPPKRKAQSAPLSCAGFGDQTMPPRQIQSTLIHLCQERTRRGALFDKVKKRDDYGSKRAVLHAPTAAHLV